MKKKKVLVGLSGGLDSTISALLLQQQGYDVIGVHFQLWHDDTAEKFSKNLPENKCCSLRDLMLARTVAKKLDIPFYVFDFRQRFYDSVVADFLARFKKGLTPNPCVECNRSIKFGFFLEKMRALGCDFVATGHYVKNIFNTEKNRWELSGGKDTHKDQTYFLYTLTQKRLGHCLFPMAEYDKDEIREIAKKNGFETFAQKKESQGVCFYAEGSHLPFLRRKIPEAFEQGEIIDQKSGEILGTHDGVLNFTKGQRARISGQVTPKYVVDIDTQKKIVWVGGNEELFTSSVDLHTCSFTMSPLADGEKIFIKIRHGGVSIPAQFFWRDTEKKFARLELEKPTRSLTAGQSAVFYSVSGLVLGGALMG